jgi:hypothetical protein
MNIDVESLLGEGYTVDLLDTELAEQMGFPTVTGRPSFVLSPPRPKTIVSVPVICRVTVADGKVEQVDISAAAADPGYFGAAGEIWQSSGDDEQDAAALKSIDGTWDVEWDALPDSIRWHG